MFFRNLIILQLLRLAFFPFTAATATFESRSPSDVKNCGHYVGEFHLVFDISASFTMYIPRLKKLAPRLFKDLEKSFPNSRYSVGAFSDKGIGPFGGSYDICYEKLPLPNVGMDGMTAIPRDAAAALKPVKGLDGGDGPESQLDALYFSALSRSTGWTNRTTDENGNPILRVVMLATDSSYHTAPDARIACPDCDHLVSPSASCEGYYNCRGYKVRDLPLDNSVTEPDHCRTYDYPSAAQVARAFHSKDIIPLFLISTPDLIPDYRKLASWLNPRGVVVPFEQNVSDIIDRLKEGLAKISCQPTTSTVPPPTTLPPPPTTTTTVAPPTTLPPPPPTKPVMPSTAAGTTKTKGGGGHSNGVVIGASVGAAALLAVLGLGAAAVGAKYYNNAEPAPSPLEMTESFGAEPPGLDERDVVADVNLAEFT